MPTILVADDEKNILQLARMYLQAEGFTVEVATNGRETLEKVRQAKPDLLVLDLMMPEVDGWEVCRRLRKDSDLPIIMLTARGDDVDKIVGLELGADDYMTKPFLPRELVARVKALLRRSRLPSTASVSSGPVVVDTVARRVTLDGEEVELTPREYDLLK
ncbi:MAG: response regulator transcription factor, partial [Chloroflexi bacterium]|nr:response regulator transcription factor [Chloroflexota bacterium]